jgi:hypothetical protein
MTLHLVPSFAAGQPITEYPILISRLISHNKHFVATCKAIHREYGSKLYMLCIVRVLTTTIG